MVDTTEHYDDNAAVYFFLTLLGIILLPWTISMVYKLIALYDKSHVGTCRCDQCKAKEAGIEKRRRDISGFAILKFVVFVTLWIIFLLIVFRSPALESTDESGAPKLEETSFGDPWEILGLAQGASADEIKKAHKKLSIKYHPDKNKDEGAEEMFIKVSKAHQILTDPEKLAIWERYGSPDGPRAVEVGIALPSWLVSGKYTSIIVLVYSFCLVILIPGGVYLWTLQQKKYTATKISTQTLGIFFTYLSDKATFKKLLEIVSTAEEFQLKYRPEQEPVIAELRKVIPREEMITKKAKAVTKKEKTKIVKILAKKYKSLFFAHFSRLSAKVPAGLKDDYQFTIDISLKLMATLMECCLMKRMTKPAIEVIKISQMITQAAWNGQIARMTDTSLLQLPHITLAMLEAWNRAKSEKGKKVEKTLRDYLALQPEQQEHLLKEVFNLSPQQIADVRTVEKLLPTDVTADCDDKHGIITENSLVTLRFVLSRPSFPALKRKNPDAFIPAHAPYLSGAINQIKEEWWWIIVSNFNPADNTHTIFHLQKIKCLRDGTGFETKFPPLKQGRYDYEVHLLCDSYIGFDIRKVLTVDVKPASALPGLIEKAHEEKGESSEEEQDWSDEFAKLEQEATLAESDSE